jgi:hypothetical protein
MAHGGFDVVQILEAGLPPAAAAESVGMTGAPWASSGGTFHTA